VHGGRSRADDESIGKRYAGAMADIVGRLKKAGATVVVGGPGAVDSDYFNKAKPEGTKPQVYNNNLLQLSGLARKLAEAEGFPHADVFGAMMSAQEKAKTTLGQNYDVCGKDRFHPGPNGHLLMAYAFLKAMGIDGQIGAITLDLGGKATSSEG